MKRLTSMICAAAIAMSTGGMGAVSAGAQPMPVPSGIQAPGAGNNVIQIQQDQMRGTHPLARGGNQRGESRERSRGRDARQGRRGENRQRARQGRDARPRQERRQARQGRPDRGGFERRGDRAYYRGHRGYRDARRGYRQHQGWWFPPAAFVAGAIVGGAISQQPAPRGMSQAHVDWCYDRYRSYRASDNTFQPYNGPRRECRSPYG